MTFSRQKLSLFGWAALFVISVGSNSRLAADDPPSKESTDAAKPAEDSGGKDDSKEAEPAPAETTTPTAVEPGQTPRQPTVDEILKAFQQNERPVAEPIMPSSEASPESPLSDRTGDQGRLRYSDGYFLTDRVGRLVKDGTWYSLAFETEDARNDLGTIKLLPNRMLEVLVRETEGTADSVLFLVSGEITEFMGENFLLVRKAIRKRDFGNLKK